MVSDMTKPELNLVREGIYGKQAEDLTLENYRICWDPITPNQDFIICPHPHSKNLYIASGGSFHAWKFLPILGKYVVAMLQGELDSDLARSGLGTGMSMDLHMLVLFCVVRCVISFSMLISFVKAEKLYLR